MTTEARTYPILIPSNKLGNVNDTVEVMAHEKSGVVVIHCQWFHENVLHRACILADDEIGKFIPLGAFELVMQAHKRGLQRPICFWADGTPCSEIFNRDVSQPDSYWTKWRRSE